MRRFSSPKLLLVVSDLCTFRKVEVGEVLFRENEIPAGIHLLVSARIRLSKRSADGDLVIQPDLEPDAILGLSDLLADRPYPVTAQVVSPGEIGYISARQLAASIHTNVGTLAAAVRDNLELRVQLTSLLVDSITIESQSALPREKAG
jgi:CRP-like cAMP-binding protein